MTEVVSFAQHAQELLKLDPAAFEATKDSLND